MSFDPLPADEHARLAALRSYHILDTLEEEDFDDLTTVAAAICQVSVALISFVDEKRQWFKSHKGMSINETPIEQSFCAHAIVATTDITVVKDTHQDDRFKDNPLVTGDPHICFYAGVPLVNEEGYKLGTLCVIDDHSRTLTNEQEAALKIVAKQVMYRLELRRRAIAAEAAFEAVKLSEQKVHGLNASLLISNARTRSFIQQAPVSIIIFRGADLLIEMVNASMLNLLGKDDSIIGKPLLDAIPELKDQPAYLALRNVYITGETIYGNDTPVLLQRNGRQEQGYFNFSYSPLVEDGQITGIIDMALEVTEQVAARRAIEESEERFRTMAESSGILIAVGNETSNITYFSKAWVQLTGRSMEDLLAFNWVDMVHEEDRNRYVNIYLDAFKERVQFSGEFRVLNKDGKYRWLLAQGLPRFRADDSFAGYIISCVDITERKEDDQRKNDFISMVSHELKTPLTSTKAYVQLLMNKISKKGDTLSAGVLEKVDRQLSKMNTMINGFLNVSRFTSGKIYIDKQRFDMADLVKEAEDEAVPTYTSHRLIFEPVEPTFVCADRDKIGHVINNLISNAVKYSPIRTTIQIACITIDGNAQVSVKDQGRGIKPADAEKLFDRYYRVESEDLKSIAGFGIGLYLCKEIIERHNGKIWVESEPGIGSTFYFTLPLDR